jgi:hypothetical protein
MQILVINYYNKKLYKAYLLWDRSPIGTITLKVKRYIEYYRVVYKRPIVVPCTNPRAKQTVIPARTF